MSKYVSMRHAGMNQSVLEYHPFAFTCMNGNKSVTLGLALNDKALSKMTALATATATAMAMARSLLTSYTLALPLQPIAIAKNA